MNIAVITGASSGIGEHFLRQVVRERSAFGCVPFDEIWVIARRADRLLSMKSELDPVRIRVFMLDLTSDNALKDMAEELQKRKPSIGLLVNCAGVGYTGCFETVPRGEIHKMIALNCAVLAEFTSVCLPYMIPTGDLCTYPTGPRIINIASSAGFLPQPGSAVYAASKAFVIHFSRALQAELRIHNIASTTVCPGPVATEFAAVATGVPGAKAKGFKSLFVVKPERLVKKSILASKKGRGLYVYGLSQKILHVLTKILPARFLIFLVTKLSKDARPPENPAPVQTRVLQASADPVVNAAGKTAGQGDVMPSPVPLTSAQAARILSLYPGKFRSGNTANN
ncbi:MAG: SDR family NAD(P)-dependent oxidoreductase [Eubacteriales bacterium]